MALATGWLRPAGPVLHHRRRQDDREPDHKESQGEGRKPLGKSEVLGEHIDDLQSHPGANRVDAQHLPQRAAVNLLDQLLHAVSASMPAKSACARTLKTGLNGWLGQ